MIDEELSRIRAFYGARDSASEFARYSLFRRGELYMRHDREDAILKSMRRQGITSISDIDILEVGCGRGDKLADFQRWGADPQRLHGIDLLENYVVSATAANPGYAFVCGSAASLPYPSNCFDIVSQFTVVSSILNEQVRIQVAREMTRVARPGGFILWYDFRFPSPGNNNVRPVTKSELFRLFPGMDIDMCSVTLLPPVARLLAPLSTIMASLLSLVPLFRSHYVAVIKIPKKKKYAFNS